MFKYLNPRINSLSRQANKNNLKKILFTSKNFRFSSINNSMYSKAYSSFDINTIYKAPKKNIFSKIFNRQKDKKTEETDKDALDKDLKTTKNSIDTDNLKFQDKSGQIILNKENSNVNNGEYHFSYQTEAKLDNFNEQDAKNLSEEELFNPGFELDKTFSRHNLRIDNFIEDKKELERVSQEQKKEELTSNNFTKLAAYFDYKLTHIAQIMVEKYNQLNFNNDIMPFIKQMNELGFDNNLLKSIFRKNFLFFLEKRNVELCINQIKVLEKNFKFSKKDAIEIIGCNPELIYLTELKIIENYNFIQNFLELDNNKTNSLIIDFPITLSRASVDDYKKIDVYLQIYLNMQTIDLKKLVQKNPLLFIIEAENILDILKAVNSLGLNKEEFKDFLEKDSKCLLFKSSHFKNIFAFLRKYDIKASETFSLIQRFPELVIANRHSLLAKKLTLLEELIPQKSTIRTLIRMYPFVLLKSYNSFVRKILYFNKELEKNILELEIFPVIFVFNFYRDIKPRCEIMRRKENWLPLKEAFALSPQKFAEKIGVTEEEYNRYVENSAPLYERDLLFKYNKYFGM